MLSFKSTHSTDLKFLNLSRLKNNVNQTEDKHMVNAIFFKISYTRGVYLWVPVFIEELTGCKLCIDLVC